MEVKWLGYVARLTHVMKELFLNLMKELIAHET
jgi:hypothetical protein